MNQVVDQAWMIAMIHPRFFQHTCRAHVGRDVTSGVGGAENRQPVESSRVDIVRVPRMQLSHRVFEAKVAPLLASLSIEDFNRVQVLLLAVGLCLGSARRW